MSTIPLKTVGMRSWEVPRAKRDRGASYAFVIFAAILAAIAFTTPISDSWMHSTYENYDNVADKDASVREGTPARQIALGSLGLIGLAALAWPGEKVFRINGLLGIVCIAYLAWCATSCLWSDDFAMSLRRCVALACELAAGLAIAKRSTARQFVWIVFVCTLAWLGLGIVAELSLGTLRPWLQDYRFAGIFHPNEMGVNCALLAMSSLYLGSSMQRGSRLFYAIAGVATVFVWQTGSRTAMAAMLISIIAVWFITISISQKLSYSLVVGLAVAGVAMAVGLGMFDINANTISMGRPDNDISTFTGRVPLWQELLQTYALQSPIVGHGYGAFWSTDHIAELSKSQNWLVASTHSTYIDLLLNVGCIGAVLCCLAMVLALVGALRLERRQAKAGYGFIAMIIVYAMVAGIFETTIGTTWFLSFFGICGISFLLLDGDDRQTAIASTSS